MDLNKLQDFEIFVKDIDLFKQLIKVKEEYKEVKHEINALIDSLGDDDIKEDAVGELLDLMTASYNLIHLILGDKQDKLDMCFDRHIRKLEKYRITKYSSDEEVTILKDRLEVILESKEKICPRAVYEDYNPEECDGTECPQCIINWLQGGRKFEENQGKSK